MLLQILVALFLIMFSQQITDLKQENTLLHDNFSKFCQQITDLTNENLLLRAEVHKLTENFLLIC